MLKHRAKFVKLASAQYSAVTAAEQNINKLRCHKDHSLILERIIIIRIGKPAEDPIGDNKTDLQTDHVKQDKISMFRQSLGGFSVHNNPLSQRLLN